MVSDEPPISRATSSTATWPMVTTTSRAANFLKPPAMAVTSYVPTASSRNFVGAIVGGDGVARGVGAGERGSQIRVRDQGSRGVAHLAANCAGCLGSGGASAQRHRAHENEQMDAPRSERGDSPKDLARNSFTGLRPPPQRLRVEIEFQERAAKPTSRGERLTKQNPRAEAHIIRGYAEKESSIFTNPKKEGRQRNTREEMPGCSFAAFLPGRKSTCFLNVRQGLIRHAHVVDAGEKEYPGARGLRKPPGAAKKVVLAALHAARGEIQDRSGRLESRRRCPVSARRDASWGPLLERHWRRPRGWNKRQTWRRCAARSKGASSYGANSSRSPPQSRAPAWTAAAPGRGLSRELGNSGMWIQGTPLLASQTRSQRDLCSADADDDPGVLADPVCVGGRGTDYRNRRARGQRREARVRPAQLK